MLRKRPTLKLQLDDDAAAPPIENMKEEDIIKQQEEIVRQAEREEQRRGEIGPDDIITTAAAISQAEPAASDAAAAAEVESIINSLKQFYGIKLTREEVLDLIAKINNKKAQVIAKIDENRASTQQTRDALYDLLKDPEIKPISNKISRKMMIYRGAGAAGAPKIIKFYFPYKVEHEPPTVRNHHLNRIVDEITFQIYARELNQSCSFKSPAVHEYGRFFINNINDGAKITGFERNYKYVGFCYFIVMDYMSAPALSDLVFSSEMCDGLSKKINKLDKCLVQHLLFHNDFNQSNLLVRDYMGKNKLALIDYGEASKKLSSAISGASVEPRRYSCNRLRRTQRHGIVHRRKKTRRAKKSVAASMATAPPPTT